MTRETHRSSNERYRYGICLNDECPKCKEKVVQQIPMRKEFKCENCESELRECPPPKKRNGKTPLIIGASIVVIVGIVVALLLLGDKSEPEEQKDEQSQDELVVSEIDTIVADVISDEDDNTVEPVVMEQDPPQPVVREDKPVKPIVSKLDLGYATYEPMEGASGIKDGKPHGNGIMRFKSRQTIPGTVDCVAEPGEWVNGMWRDGKINAGTWYRNDGNQVIVKLGQRYNK